MFRTIASAPHCTQSISHIILAQSTNEEKSHTDHLRVPTRMQIRLRSTPRHIDIIPAQRLRLVVQRLRDVPQEMHDELHGLFARFR